MTEYPTLNFKKTLQKSNAWLDDLKDSMGWSERRRAYMALKTVLHVIRDQLEDDAAIDFAADMPLLIRTIYFEGWKQGPHKLPKVSSKEEFLWLIERELGWDKSVSVEDLSKNVFYVFSKQASPTEIKNISHSLPEHLRSFLVH